MSLVNPGDSTPWCGGSLISSLHVITAAHCTRGHSAASVQVRVGEHDHTNSGADVYNVADIDHHPGFQFEAKVYDFSLLTLASPVNFSTKAKMKRIFFWNESESAYLRFRNIGLNQIQISEIWVQRIRF